MPANTPKGLPYPLPTEPVAEGAQAIRSLAEAIDPQLVGAPSATPPASPVDGQLWALLADAADGVVWVFRYRAASPDPAKWEFVGGTSTYALVTAAESPLTNAVGGWTWCDPTPGPDFIVPRAGIYRVRIGAAIAGPAGGASIAVAAANVSAAPLGTFVTASIPSPGMQFALSHEASANVSAADTLRLVVYQYAASTTFGARTIAVTPVRVQ